MEQMYPAFVPFRKIPRLTRECSVTEKLDGTNGVLHVTGPGCLCGDHDPRGEVLAGSRSRWLTLSQDNHGFAAWVDAHKEELLDLGPGYHHGEWWGGSIQGRYRVYPKQFSLFNVTRWSAQRPACCGLVPVLYEGVFDTSVIEEIVALLRTNGSVAAPGCKAEGVVIFHKASRTMFKKLCEHDEVPKGRAE